MNKKVVFALATWIVLSFSSAFADYKEIQCTSDAAFEANSCNQCFEGESKAEGDNIGLLTDKWDNPTTNDQIVFKEEQKMPFMVNLSEGNVSWEQVPGSEGFWEYTQEFNSLFSQKDEGYVLKAGQSIVWLKSKLGYAYKLQKNTAPAGSNIGLLVYPFKAHSILADGKQTLDDTEHRECVVFKSDAKKVVTPETPVTPEQPKKPVELPKTGPEHIILLLVAMLIGTGLILFRKKA